MSTGSLPTAMTKVAVLGGTGQVGTELVDALIREPTVQEVRLFSRRASTDPRIVGNPKIKEYVDAEMDEITLASDSTCSLLFGADASFSTIGLGKPSQFTCEELEKADLVLPEAFFLSSRKAGVPVAAVMTVYNADPDASIWFKNSTAAGGFYAQIKGRLEDAVTAMNFPRLLVFRPGVITDNPNSGSFANGLMSVIGGILPGGLAPITKQDLGQAICSITNFSFGSKPISTTVEGSTRDKKIYTSDTMNEIAELVKEGASVPSLLDNATTRTEE